MKRILCFLLTLVLVFGLCACSAPASADETTVPTTTGSTEPDPVVREDLQKLLSGRLVPELKTRDEMLDILQKEVYGYMPAEPTELTFTTEYDVVST